jgi:glycosyltransferase involved in cell wall biosynthesis
VRFLARPELQREMGGQALAKIRRYGIRDQVGHLLNIYEELSEQGSPKSALDLDIVLYDSGQRWDLHVREAFHQLAEVEKRLERRLLICHVDLSEEETVQAAKLLLIPSAGRDTLRHALEALQRQTPIVVRKSDWQLKALCVASNAGLFYSSADELQECVWLLLSNEPLRQIMGAKGRQFVQSMRI